MILPAALLRPSRKSARACEPTLLGQIAIGVIAYGLAFTVIAPIYAAAFGVAIGFLSRCGLVEVRK